ncbi:MAG: hypothetical protein ACO3KD_09525, partial [Gaiellales bacterium]
AVTLLLTVGHGLLLTMDSTVARMARLGRHLVSEVPLLTDDEVARRIDQVGEQGVRDLAAELFAPENLCVAGIGSDRAAFERALDAFRASVGGAA